MAGIGRVGLERQCRGILAGAPPGAQRAAFFGGGLATPRAAAAQLLVAVEGAMAGIGRVGLEGGSHGVESEPAPPAPGTLRLGGSLATPRAAATQVVVGGAGAMAGIGRVGLEGGSHGVEALATPRAARALQSRDSGPAPVTATAELNVTYGVPVARIRRVVAERRRLLHGAAALEGRGHPATKCRDDIRWAQWHPGAANKGLTPGEG